MNNWAYDKRFEEVYKQGSGFGTSVKILVDRETGVQYLFTASGYAGGLSVLVDKDGKPMVHTGR